METTIAISLVDLGLKIINTLSTIDRTNQDYKSLIEGSKIKIRSAIIKLKSCGFNPPRANVEKIGYWNYDARQLNKNLQIIAETLDEVSILLKSVKPEIYDDLQAFIDKILEIKAECVIYANHTTSSIPAVPLEMVKDLNGLLDILCKIDEKLKN